MLLSQSFHLGTKTGKKSFVKNCKYLYWFSQCFGTCQSYVQINSSDYCVDASSKLKYLNSYDYVFNPVLFIVSLEGSHFWFRESMSLSHQDSQTSRERGRDIWIVKVPLLYTLIW